MHAAPARREAAVVDGHIALQARELHAALGDSALPLPRASVALFIVDPRANVRALLAFQPLVCLAVFVVPFDGRECGGRDFFPVCDVLDLQHGAGEALAVDAVDGGEGYAEVADARIVEVLAAALVADVPGVVAGVVFFDAVVALYGDVAVSTVFGLHVDFAERFVVVVLPGIC